MESLEGKSIGQIVTEDYRAARILQEYKLDFCCNGERSIDAACQSVGADINEVIGAIKSATENGCPENAYNDWSLGRLADHIVDQHHTFTREEISEIQVLAHKVAKSHSSEHPELKKMEHEFMYLSMELTSHLNKEERNLFPFIKKLASGDIEGANDFRKQSEFDPIRMLGHEHTEAIERLAKIRTLSNGYTLPAEACNRHQELYNRLIAFEQDMHKHIHLENNILFPQSDNLI